VILLTQNVGNITPYFNQHAVIQICRRYPVKKLQLFGSAVIGTFDPDKSDFDLLIDFAESENLFDTYFNLKFELEKILKRDVDLLDNQALVNPYVRQRVEKEARIVYEA